MNLKSKLKKKCALMGVTFGLTYSALMTFSQYTGGGIAYLLGFYMGMALGSGLMYGFIMYIVLSKQQKAMLNRFPEMAQVMILDEHVAYRLSAGKPKAVSGWCFLTADCLYYSTELKKHAGLSLKLPLYQIAALKVERFNRRECIKITTVDQSVLFLQMGNHNAEWAIKINQAIQAIAYQQYQQYPQYPQYY